MATMPNGAIIPFSRLMLWLKKTQGGDLKALEPPMSLKVADRKIYTAIVVGYQEQRRGPSLWVAFPHLLELWCIYELENIVKMEGTPYEKQRVPGPCALALGVQIALVT